MRGLPEGILSHRSITSICEMYNFTMVVLAFNKRRGYIGATAQFHSVVDRVEDLRNTSFGLSTSKK
jgi:hypothetical protein